MPRASEAKIPVAIRCNRCDGKMRAILIETNESSTISTYHCSSCDATEVKVELAYSH
jgi:hypothetical protein